MGGLTSREGAVCQVAGGARIEREHGNHGDGQGKGNNRGNIAVLMDTDKDPVDACPKKPHAKKESETGGSPRRLVKYKPYEAGGSQNAEGEDIKGSERKG